MGIRDDIRYAMKRKEVTLMVLADFSKAFDTISFSATIVKFYKPFLKWLLSYLSGRSQYSCRSTIGSPRTSRPSMAFHSGPSWDR